MKFNSDNYNENQLSIKVMKIITSNRIHLHNIDEKKE